MVVVVEGGPFGLTSVEADCQPTAPSSPVTTCMGGGVLGGVVSRVGRTTLT